MSAWSDFLKKLDQARAEIKCSRSGAWYRGLSSASYTLIPKLLRQPYKPEAEGNIYRAYLRTRMANSESNSWLNLIDMQHYRIPTRLLDWTESFAVALFFAIGDSDNPDSPCIWVLNPFTLACRARGNNNKSLGDFHLDPEMDYYHRFIKDKNWPYEYPMPFYSPTPNERIMAQRGFFTIHGNDPRPLEKTCSRHVRQVILPKEAIPDAKEFLRMASIDYDTLFPDQEGWLKRVERDYFYSPEEVAAQHALSADAASRRG